MGHNLLHFFAGNIDGLGFWKNGTKYRLVAQPSISQEESYLIGLAFYKYSQKDKYDQLGVCNSEKEE